MNRPRSHAPAWRLLQREHGIDLSESELHDVARAVYLGERPKLRRIIGWSVAALCAIAGCILVGSALTGISTPDLSLTLAAIAFIAAGVLWSIS